MKFLVVEDEPKIKTEIIDDIMVSRGDTCEWAKNQQEAAEFLAAGEFDLVLLDLQIPSRPGGRPLAEFGKNTLKQIRELKGATVPVVLMTGYHQDCVDLMADLQELGLNGSISKPFPPTGRTLNVVIDEVLDKFRRTRRPPAVGEKRQLKPFEGGVLAFYPRHIDLLGETVVGVNQKGYHWRILQLLRDKNDRGRAVRMDSTKMAAKLHPNLGQNTLSQAIKALRDRITETMRNRLDLDCGQFDVIDNRGQGYHLRDWIVVEVHDQERASVPGKSAVPAQPVNVPSLGLSDRQQWILEQLRNGAKLTRRQIEQQFGISVRTAKRDIGELVEAGMAVFDRAASPGIYRVS